VWTPKRIALLVCGFVIFFGAYALYGATFLGRIDSLPPLPEPYHRPTGNVHVVLPPRPRERPIDKKLAEAFGPVCEELKRAHRLFLNSKSMAVSAESVEFQDGLIKLTPISLAVFSKPKGDGKGPEINTVRARAAYLTFDRPVNGPNDISGRKLVKAELFDNIYVVNNRRTPARDDDMTVFIAKGPLIYEEPKHLVWTHDEIHLIDLQSKPDPTDIRGKGLEMDLVTEAPQPAKPGAPAKSSRPKNETITGVRQIKLRADVTMDLYLTSGQGPLVGNTHTAAAPPPPAPPANGKPAAQPTKEHVKIHTPGPFQYDFCKDYDLARFDVPGGDLACGSRVPVDVTVIRFHGKDGPQDQLICQHLELRLRHRDNKPKAAAPAGGQARPPAGQEPDQALEVETAHATARGADVVMTSDSEKMWARGNDFFYDAIKKLTVLKGDNGITVDRDQSVIRARELQMQEVKAPPRPGVPPGATFQHVIALGPGTIDMFSKTTEKQSTHAYWTERLISTKEGGNDLLILVGGARFVDDEHDQNLQAETLKVWLLPEDPNKKPAPAKPAAARPAPSSQANGTVPGMGEGGRKPEHLEAIQNVSARSRELIIHDTERLVVWFKDVPSLPGPPPANKKPAAQPAAPSTHTTAAPASAMPVAAAPQPSPAATSPMQPAVPAPNPAMLTPGPVTPAAPPPGGPPRLQAPVAAPATPGQEPPPRPIDLSARSVEAWVLRAEDKSQLDKLWTKGNVHVRQEPAKPDEKAVDITGSTLEMIYHPEGNELAVSGEGGDAANDLAQLQMDKIYIIGPTVNIDQATNRAWVHGAGAMQMESATDFQGSKLDHPVPLTVQWARDMYFNGVYAEFFGNIQAEQENAHLACQRLQVFFDRPVSLKEGGHSDQPAKVRNLVCDKNVRVDDSTIEHGRLVKYQLIRGTALQMTTLEEDGPRPPNSKEKEGNLVTVSGPGDVRMLGRGATDPLAAPGNRGGAGSGPAAGKNDEQSKLTYVNFQHRMDANSKTNTANFYGAVRVLNFPSENPHQEIDLDAILARPLPEGMIFLRCDRLKVLDRREGDRSNQQMEATGRVRVQGPDFMAEADKVTYEEQKDLVIFIGTETNPAVLSKYPKQPTSGEPQTLVGKKIYYRRSTGEGKVDSAESIRGN
jgi:hypothetical protein